jgi:hypothetical protein
LGLSNIFPAGKWVFPKKYQFKKKFSGQWLGGCAEVSNLDGIGYSKH